MPAGNQQGTFCTVHFPVGRSASVSVAGQDPWECDFHLGSVIDQGDTATGTEVCSQPSSKGGWGTRRWRWIRVRQLADWLAIPTPTGVPTTRLA